MIYAYLELTCGIFYCIEKYRINTYEIHLAADFFRRLCCECAML